MIESPQQHLPARDRVLNAAYVCFLQSGYAAASMQQIADEAGITKATLYHHFRDKADLYLETMRLAMLRTEAAIAESLSLATDLESAVLQLLRQFFSGDSADLQRLAADFRQHFDSETQRQFWRQYHPPWQLIGDPVAAAAARGELREQDVVFVTRHIYGCIAGLSHLYRFEQGSGPVDTALLERISATILHGVMTPEQHRELRPRE